MDPIRKGSSVRRYPVEPHIRQRQTSAHKEKPEASDARRAARLSGAVGLAALAVGGRCAMDTGPGQVNARSGCAFQPPEGLGDAHEPQLIDPGHMITKRYP